MQLLIRIVEDLSIMVLTIVVLVVAFYLALLALDRGLKWKTGTREEEGLADLWQATVLKPADKEEAGEQVLERKDPR
ncbi:MAG: hypothetical protein KFF50_00410 [Desulfatitalea sp.]|nr:hypothetical protein [Desulfatitalea sp.]